MLRDLSLYNVLPEKKFALNAEAHCIHAAHFDTV
jgi:hypothetical protein